VMLEVGIFYFSGTGNTELAAEKIKEEFEKRNCKVDLIKMEEVLKGINNVRRSNIREKTSAKNRFKT
jgi:flavodoxin